LSTANPVGRCDRMALTRRSTPSSSLPKAQRHKLINLLLQTAKALEAFKTDDDDGVGGEADAAELLSSVHYAVGLLDSHFVALAASASTSSAAPTAVAPRVLACAALLVASKVHQNSYFKALSVVRASCGACESEDQLLLAERELLHTAGYSIYVQPRSLNAALAHFSHTADADEAVRLRFWRDCALYVASAHAQADECAAACAALARGDRDPSRLEQLWPSAKELLRVGGSPPAGIRRVYGEELARLHGGTHTYELRRKRSNEDEAQKQKRRRA
jgi:hypothetical protein